MYSQMVLVLMTTENLSFLQVIDGAYRQTFADEDLKIKDKPRAHDFDHVRDLQRPPGEGCHPGSLVRICAYHRHRDDEFW